MTAPKSASSIFAALGATISALGNVGEGRFGHRADTENDLLSDAKPLNDKEIGHFGHQKQEIPGSETPNGEANADGGAGERGSCVESHHSQVSKLSEVSNPLLDQGLEGGHQSPLGVQTVSEEAGTTSRNVNDINPDALDALQEACRQICIPPPADDTPAAWRLWLRERIDRWLRPGRSPSKAGKIAWGEAENIWHHRHGATPSRDRCAGCDAYMLDEPGMRLPDGAVIHIGPDYGFECRIAYGDRWRGAAHAGLVALGLDPPECEP